MQVRWVRYALEQVRSYGGPRRGVQHRRRDALLQEMTHFVSHLHSFVMDRLLHTAWPALEQANALPVRPWQSQISLVACRGRVPM
jgi:hypothetical protein